MLSEASLQLQQELQQKWRHSFARLIEPPTTERSGSRKSRGTSFSPTRTPRIQCPRIASYAKGSRLHGPSLWITSQVAIRLKSYDNHISFPSTPRLDLRSTLRLARFSNDACMQTTSSIFPVSAKCGAQTRTMDGTSVDTLLIHDLRDQIHR